LAFVILTPRGGTDVVGNPTPTPVQQETVDPVQQHIKLVDSSQQVLRAQIGKGNVKDIEGVTGDIVWSDEKQAGYIRVKGLPKNDPGSATYQLWIFAENQDAKYPADGGTFDINADGEVIIPVDSRVKVRNPSAFAITIEKAGGVVVSDRVKIAALAKA
jgi:anti-sigma-K factor RskA